MKNFKLLSLLLVILSLTVSCSDDNETTALYTLSGKVTMTDTGANGAIVSVSTAPNAATVIMTVVADENGDYSVRGLEKGMYYVSTMYNPANTNNLKSTGSITLTGPEVEVDLSDNATQNLALEGVASNGTGVVNLNDGWAFDMSHTSVGFEFPYDALNGLFKGQFARAGVDAFEFNEADPSATVIKAWVDLTSTETGAPSGVCGHGRDGITGCIQGTFGLELDPANTQEVYCPETGEVKADYPNTSLVEYNLWGDGSATTYTKQSAIIGATGVATFEATEVSAYGNGYLAKGDFTFAGSTHQVNLYFSYLEGFEKENRQGINTKYSSFYGWFEFAAETDYNIISSHVLGADVKAVIGLQFNKQLQ